MHGAKLTSQGGAHVCFHDVPAVVVVFLAVFTHEEDAEYPSGFQCRAELRNQLHVFENVSAVFVTEGRHGLLSVKQRSRIIRVVCEGILRHEGVEVHNSNNNCCGCAGQQVISFRSSRIAVPANGVAAATLDDIMPPRVGL